MQGKKNGRGGKPKESPGPIKRRNTSLWRNPVRLWEERQACVGKAGYGRDDRRDRTTKEDEEWDIRKTIVTYVSTRWSQRERDEGPAVNNFGGRNWGKNATYLAAGMKDKVHNHDGSIYLGNSSLSPISTTQKGGAGDRKLKATLKGRKLRRQEQRKKHRLDTTGKVGKRTTTGRAARVRDIFTLESPDTGCPAKGFEKIPAPRRAYKKGKPGDD